jgi:hypothetical protein
MFSQLNNPGSQLSQRVEVGSNHPAVFSQIGDGNSLRNQIAVS